MGIIDEQMQELEEMENIILQMVSAHGDDAVRLEGEKGFISACIIRDIAANYGMAAMQMLGTGEIGVATMMVKTGVMLRTLADLSEGKDFKKQSEEGLRKIANDLGVDPDA